MHAVAYAFFAQSKQPIWYANQLLNKYATIYVELLLSWRRDVVKK